MRLDIYLKTRVKKNFAKMLGISVNALANYESGRRLVPLDVALHIYEITNKMVRPKDLLGAWISYSPEKRTRSKSLDDYI